MEDEWTDTNERPKISVLYVDDERDLLDLGKIFLERSGEFRVDTRTSATETLKLSSLGEYDAIVSDYQMPDMNGIDFLQEIRGTHRDMPFILFTGRGREEVVIQAINKGADFYIQKGGDPIAQFAELGHKIREAVGRRLIEQMLRETEKKFSDIIAFLPDPTFAIDQSGRIIAWNRALEELTGFSSDRMLGSGKQQYQAAFYTTDRPLLIDLIDEPDEEVRKYYSIIHREEGSITAEAESIKLNGTKIFVHIKVSRLYNQSGVVTGAIESIRDITFIKQKDLEFHTVQERYRSIVHDQTEMVIRFVPDGTVTFINDTFGLFYSQIMNQTPVEGGRISDLLQDTYPKFEEFITSLSRENPIRDIEQEITGSDGRRFWHLWSVRALYDMDDNLSEYQAVGRDITELKLAETALRESEAGLRLFIEKTSDSFTLIDEEGVIIEWNARSERLSGFSKEDVIGMKIWDLFCRLATADRRTEENRKKAEETFRNSLATGVIPFYNDRIIEIERSDGARISVRQILFPIKTTRGFRIGLITRDSTRERDERASA
ncbi:PAS domain S-box protein [uncultured Methanospirillum sp.]|uniref:response regulator n=1 Tax=uncultured Methanospirillum sp. TaxID=262503 RepID=UPI0029C8CAD0|nr:PAS domain S-box protein [uncultured Methanospirillum sp.]